MLRLYVKNTDSIADSLIEFILFFAFLQGRGSGRRRTDLDDDKPYVCDSKSRQILKSFNLHTDDL